MSNTKNLRDNIVAGSVAVMAFAASASHIITVATEAGNWPPISVAHALGIDGLIYIGIRAMQRGAKAAGLMAMVYGAAISLIFNAASYGAFSMPKIVIAFTMPVAMLLAFLVVHSGHGEDNGTEDKSEDKATRTHVRLDVQRESVPLSRPAAVPMSRPATVPAVLTEVVQPAARKEITRAPINKWDVAHATRMIEAGTMNNEEIGAVVGTSAKTIQRLRKKINEASTE